MTSSNRNVEESQRLLVMFKKIIAFLIRLSFVKKYLSARVNAFSSDPCINFNAASIEYWVYYVLTGKSKEKSEE